MPAKPKPPTLASLRKAARRVYGKAFRRVCVLAMKETTLAYLTNAHSGDLLLVRAKDEPAARRDLLTCLQALEKSR